MGNFNQAQFESFLFSLEGHARQEPILRATQTQVLIGWETSAWLRPDDKKGPDGGF